MRKIKPLTPQEENIRLTKLVAEISKNPKEPYYLPETQTMISMPKLISRLDMTRHGILKWVREGKFPKPLKPGGHYGHAYWRIEDVQKWERGEFKDG